MPSGESQVPQRERRPRGFTLIEAVAVLLIVAVVVGALTPAVVRTLSHARVNRAASVVASDFYLAQSLAGRQHSPVVMTFDATNKMTTIAQPPPTSTSLYVRRYGVDSEFKLSAYSASPSSVLVLPNGTGSMSITVTLGDGTYSRQVKMTRAGQIRVL